MSKHARSAHVHKSQTSLCWTSSCCFGSFWHALAMHLVVVSSFVSLWFSQAITIIHASFSWWKYPAKA